jgi:AcrR family transcriptional regulator
MATRERIIKAAFELISIKGYQGATTREIAKSAGVAEVTIFRHFTNKETLFAEVLQSFSTIPTLAELIPKLNKMDYENGIRLLTFSFISRLEELRDWLRILNTEVGYAPEILQDQYNAFMNQIFSLLTEYFEDVHNRGLLLDGLEPQYVARTFHSLTMGFFYVEGFLGVKSGLAESCGSVMDAFVDIFCRGTKAPG